MELFKKLNDEGATIIQVTHSEVNASYGNKLIKLFDGWLKSETTTAEMNAAAVTSSELT